MSEYVGFDSVQSMKGFDRIEHVAKSNYRDTSTIVIVPTRGQEVINPETGETVRQPMIHKRVYESWQNMIWPMNGKRIFCIVTGAEVGQAYNEQIQGILAHPDLRNWKYVMTMEDDNIQPPDAAIRLMETIQEGPYDGVSGLYFTKGEINLPMCYGDPVKYSMTGELEFRPRNVVKDIEKGRVVECNGIANGCSLFKLSLFKEIPAPWFETISDITPDGAMSMTQDLYFCKKAKQHGKRFAVDCRVRVGHLDVYTGEVY